MDTLVDTLVDTPVDTSVDTLVDICSQLVDTILSLYNPHGAVKSDAPHSPLYHCSATADSIIHSLSKYKISRRG